jgi:MFS family permease
MNQKNFEFSRIAESSILPKKISAIQRLKLNLVTICVVNYISNISIFIVSPSLHQFVKGNSSDDTVSPGLGLDETWYSAIIGIQACGIVVGAISYGIVGRYIYFKFAIICSLLLYISGGLLHSFAVNGWMLLLSKTFDK